MFDIGGMELLVIGAVALIVVGPKELPRLVRSVGQWVGRAKSLARDFQSGMEDAARQADLQADVANLKNLSADIERDFKGAGENARRAIEDSGTKSRWTPPKRVAVSDPTRSSPPQPTTDPPDHDDDEFASTHRTTPASGAPSDDDDALLSRFERGVRRGNQD
jgi:sec-independent protein translocase protein TatB